VLTSLVLDDGWALVISLAVAAVLVGLWYVFPLSLRDLEGDRRDRAMDKPPAGS
jgi:hypothetical protein